MDKQPKGLVGMTLNPGKEQYCPEGEIVQLEDGTPAKDISCTSDYNVILFFLFLVL